MEPIYGAVAKDRPLLEAERGSRRRFWVALGLLELGPVNAGVGLKHQVDVTPDCNRRFDVAQDGCLLHIVTFWD